MPALNHVAMIGHLGTDPSMRYTPNGSPVTDFRLAVSRKFTGKDGERQDDTEWFTVVCWNDLGESVNQYLAKGRLVYVDGRLHSVTYTGNDGERYFRNEIIAKQVVFLSSPQESVDNRPSTDENDPDSADDLPF